jgi:hypothetical protein
VFFAEQPTVHAITGAGLIIAGTLIVGASQPD